MIVKPGARNEKGKPIDVMANIRAKRKLAQELFPLFADLLKENSIYLDDEAKKENTRCLKDLKKVAKQFDIDLGDTHEP